MFSSLFCCVALLSVTRMGFFSTPFTSTNTRWLMIVIPLVVYMAARCLQLPEPGAHLLTFFAVGRLLTSYSLFLCLAMPCIAYVYVVHAMYVYGM